MNLDIISKESKIKFLFSFLFSVIVFYILIPKNNPYIFPDDEDIDSHTYIDDKGVCYKYRRLYKKCQHKSK